MRMDFSIVHLAKINTILVWCEKNQPKCNSVLLSPAGKNYFRHLPPLKCQSQHIELPFCGITSQIAPTES